MLLTLQFKNELCVVGVPSNAVAVGSTSRYTDAVTLDAQVILYHKRSPLCPVHLRGRLPRRLRTRGVEEPFSACSDNPAVEADAKLAKTLRNFPRSHYKLADEWRQKNSWERMATDETKPVVLRSKDVTLANACASYP